MTKIEKIMPDTRSFQEVYRDMTSMERAEFKVKVMKTSMVTESAIRNWANGHRTPALVHQTNIAKALKSLKIETTPSTLFPTAKLS